MDSSLPPMWIKTTIDFQPLEVIIWPNIKGKADTEMFARLTHFAKTFSHHPRKLVMTFTVDREEGKLVLCKSNNYYLGIWVPNKFRRLSSIIETAFYNYYCDTQKLSPTLIDFVDGFHSYRVVEPRAFTSFSDNELALPPIWLLNNQQIEEIAQRCKVEDITTHFRPGDIVNYIFRTLNKKQQEALYSVPEEHKLTLSRILDKWISFLDRDEAFRLFWHLQMHLGTVYPDEIERFGILFLERPNIYLTLTQKELEWIEGVGEKSKKVEVKKRAYFLLGNYYRYHKNILKAISFYKKVITHSSHDYIDIVTTRSQLNLARLFYTIGDFKNSSLHFSFALTFLKQLNRPDLVIAARVEYINQRIGECVNLLHTALYLVNNHIGKLQLSQAKPLLEGVAKLLRLFNLVTGERSEIFQEFKHVTSQIVNLMRIKRDELQDIYDIDFDELILLVEQLMDSPDSPDLVKMAVKWSDILLKKKQHILKKVFVLMKDGRLLFEYDALDRKLVRKIHTADSVDLLFSSALSAVNIFLKDMISGEKVDADVERIDMDGFSITVTEGKYIIFATIALHTPIELSTKIREITEKFEEDFEFELRMWMGDMSQFRDVDQYIEELNIFASEDSNIE